MIRNIWNPGPTAVDLRVAHQWLTASNRTIFDDSNDSRIKSVGQELLKSTGVDGYSGIHPESASIFESSFRTQRSLIEDNNLRQEGDKKGIADEVNGNRMEYQWHWLCKYVVDIS